MGIFLCLKKKEGNGVGELSVFCQSYFNKTLIGQAGSIGRKARQEVGSKETGSILEAEAPSVTPAQTTEEATCKLSQLKKVRSHYG